MLNEDLKEMNTMNLFWKADRGYNFVSVAFLFSLYLERAVFFFVFQTCSNLQLFTVFFLNWDLFKISKTLPSIKH